MKAELKESKDKNGNPYVYLSIMLTPTYEKRVFLDNAEKELVRLSLNKED